MMKQRENWILPPFVVLLLLLASGLACGGRAERNQPATPPVVRFLSPPAGTQTSVGRQLFLQARAFARSGVARVDFAVNGSNVGSQNLGGSQRLQVATQAWTPSAAGDYTLTATAYDASGQASTPARVTITVQESFAPPSAAPAEEPSSSGSSGGQAGGQSSGGESGGEAESESGGGQSGGEPEEVVEPFVDFRADRTQLQAGESTILRWDVENVREVYLDGQPVTGHETREVWPFPPSQTYILHIVLPSGEAQDYGMTIEVAGDVELVSGPDLVVLAVDASDRESDESVPFQAEVLNAGDTLAQGAQWRWSINRSGDGPSSWNMGGQFDLAVGQTTLLRGEAPPHPQGRWTVYVEARVDGDGNTSNNRGTDGFASINPAGGGGPQEVPDLPPAPVHCRVGMTASNMVGISWDVQEMAEQGGFRIYLATTDPVTEVGDNQTSALIQDLEPNTQYHFDVRAYNNAGGESPPDACFVDVTTERP